MVLATNFLRAECEGSISNFEARCWPRACAPLIPPSPPPMSQTPISKSVWRARASLSLAGARSNSCNGLRAAPTAKPHLSPLPLTAFAGALSPTGLRAHWSERASARVRVRAGGTCWSGCCWAQSVPGRRAVRSSSSGFNPFPACSFPLPPCLRASLALNHVVASGRE